MFHGLIGNLGTDKFVSNLKTKGRLVERLAVFYY